MSRLIKRKTTSGAATEPASAAPQQQNASEIIRPSFDAWAAANFPDEYADSDARPILFAAYMAGAYTSAKLLLDNASAFAKGTFEAHGAAVGAAKAPPITA